jgi:diphosphate-dependent phosphofructokinase
METKSYLQKQRLKYKPKVPENYRDLRNLKKIEKQAYIIKNEQESIKKTFKNSFKQPVVEFQKGNNSNNKALKVGVVFSGGQAAGGHNVISGLFDSILELNDEGKLFGFLNGPNGIVNGKYIEITDSIISEYRNQGGFDLIGSGRDKIESEQHLIASLTTANQLNLDGLVIIGGDDSNTNAAILAEYFLEHNCNTKVIGIPKTIDGDLRSDEIEMSFGFDTACKTYSELIGNICKDAISAKKYYHFIRLMGRSASHIALECAFKTQANLTLIGEEIMEKNASLKDVVTMISDLIVKRAEKGKNYGVILIPEGIIEFIKEVKLLISELNKLLAHGSKHFDVIESIQEHEVVLDYLKANISDLSYDCLKIFPENIQKQLLLDRDPHGNVQVSKVETEKLLLDLVKIDLKRRSFKSKFNAVNHFFGYEGRSALPTNFDADYCYNLGRIGTLLIQNNCTGYIACVKNLKNQVDNWQYFAFPLVLLMNIEDRHGKQKPVIKKYLVDLKGKSFQDFLSLREKWEIDDQYLLEGPIQFYGDSKLTDSHPVTM